MTSEQAIQILDQAASQARLTRVEHITVQQAVETLRRALAQTTIVMPEALAHAAVPEPKQQVTEA